MGTLSQVVAIEKPVKSAAYADLTQANKVLQKAELFSGFSKSYQPKDEDGDTFPPERKRIQFSAETVLATVRHSLGFLFDIEARKDWTNCFARGSVEIDGKVILPDVPVSYLLFLEKQLVDLKTFAGNLPILDETEDWALDENSGFYKTEPTQTQRTKKTTKPIVLYQATPEHPAQTQLITEDVIAGWWNTVKHSGAMPKLRKQAILERIERLLHAVKRAREQANSQEEVPVPQASGVVFGYLFGGV